MVSRLAALTAVALLLPGTASQAAPIDTWPITHGIDCVGDRFNPIRPDGTRDPANDPLPGTAEWTARDRERLECDNQRDHDRRAHPHANVNSGRYGEDHYRQPARFDGRRFRYTYVAADVPGVTGIPGVPAAEIYRPCAPGNGVCGNMPAGLQRFEPPYPVVVIFHGFIATMNHHRFNAQVYAENGYMAIVVNGTHPVPASPNVQSNDNGDEVLDWLASPASGVIGREADLNRVGFAGHSQGAGAARSYQGDPRVHAIVAWDGGDTIADNNCTGTNPCAPLMFQRTDGAFSAPQATARTDYVDRDRGREAYLDSKARGMDVWHGTFRWTNHIDWNGNGVGSLAGNRLAEPLINYYTLAWLDRHVKARLAFSTGGALLTSDGRTELEEREYRQAIAERAFGMLTARRFVAGSIDKHNISQGFYDPVQMATSGDPVWGGNVPYAIEGMWTADRFSPYFASYCAVSVPDLINGNGQAGGPTARTADTGTGDLRTTGCV